MANFKEVLRHGANYLISNLATRALAFISIPVYTRLLSTTDYGIVNIFIGVSGILSSLLTLCCDQSISRYFFDKTNDDDFKRFVGTSTIIAVIVFIINSAILIFYAADVAKLINLSVNMVYLLIPFSFINIVSLTYQQIYSPMKESKKIAASSLLRTYIGFALAIVFIFLFKEAKYLGQVLGLILAGCFMLVFWIKGISKYFTFSFDKKYLLYIFTFSVPLIPYTLSGVIIEQFGKITIGSTQSASQAGFYSLALTISGLVSIVTTVTHQAWSPYYFEYMNSKNYEQHDKDIQRIFRFTLISAILVATFGKEIGSLLAKKGFTTSLYLIPIMTYGYVFYQLSYVYMRNVSFVHKTLYLSFIVISSGLINVLLNLFLISRFGELGASISFSFSYICMAAFAFLVNKYVIKHYGTPIITLLKPVAIYTVFIIPVYFLYYIDDIFIELLIKTLVVGGFSVIIMWRERKYVLSLFRDLNDKRKKF